MFMTARPTTTPVPAGHGARPLASESHWLLSTAGKWTEEDEKEWKRQQHRENMVYFRLKKKEQQAELRGQHRQLEIRLQQHLAMQRRAASRPAWDRQQPPTRHEKQHVAVRDLVVEREALATENAALRQQIEKHEKLQSFVYEASDGLEHPRHERISDPPSREGSSSDSSTSAASIVSASSSSRSIQQQCGWRVHFPGGEPSFHFHPFSKQQLDAVRQSYEAKFAVLPPMEVMGNMLGWQVERAPLVRHPTTNALVARVRYTRRIRCAGGSAKATMSQLDADSWPTLTTPELWGRIHSNSVTSQTLQVVDEDMHVLVRNIPERSLGLHVRYLNLVSRQRTQDRDGKRSISYAMVIANSTANTRSREAEPPRRDVHWVSEGGAFMTLSQVDDTTLEVLYDHYAGCLSEQHAQLCLVEWGHIAVRWEQLVTPSRLLVL
ncbi:hypothetical protein BBJ28_00002684 [Nothophytophthora sp. Chile5]|nr:hypothetical protein BBJ28_00002684 [Nothophytophthora sp. Chile5]